MQLCICRTNKWHADRHALTPFWLDYCCTALHRAVLEYYPETTSDPECGSMYSSALHTSTGQAALSSSLFLGAIQDAHYYLQIPKWDGTCRNDSPWVYQWFIMLHSNHYTSHPLITWYFILYRKSLRKSRKKEYVWYTSIHNTLVITCGLFRKNAGSLLKFLKSSTEIRLCN